MERTSTLQTGLILAAMVVVAAAMGLLFLAPTLEPPDIPVPAPKAQATEQEMAEAWENLVDAIRREDQAEALRIAEWLDEHLGTGHMASPMNLDIIQDWCKLSGHQQEFCEEEGDETNGALREPIIHHAASGGG